MPSRNITYAVRARVVGKYVGELLLVVAVLTTLPFCVALLFGDYAVSGRYLACAAAMLVIGLATGRIPAPNRLQSSEALVITALIFLLVPLIMTYPLMGHGLTFSVALFESISAITTTGLTAVSDLQSMDRTFLFVRAWMQWYGGLGIVVLSVALLFGGGSTARGLLRVGNEWDDLVSGARTHARRVLSVYLVLTSVGVFALSMTGVDWYAALLHGLAGVSTGGFSTYDDNMAGLGSWYSQATLMLLSFAGAVSLILYHPAHLRNWRQSSGSIEVKGLAAACLVFSVLLACCMVASGQAAWGSALRDAPLVAVSAQTGAGFSNIAVGELDQASKLLLICSMIIGGGIGSTAGGVKILRLLIVLQLLRVLMRRSCMPPHAVVEPRFGDHRLEHAEIEHVLLIILSFIAVILLSWFVFLLYDYPPLDSLFEIASATGTVGLSVGVTAADLPPLLNAVLCLDMLLGRLEIVALLLVFSPRTWFGRQAG